MFNANDDAPSGERVSARSALFWVLVGVGLLAGIVLYVKYARFLTPLLA